MMDRFPIGFWVTMTSDQMDVSAVKHWTDAGITLAISPVYMPSKGHSKANMIEILDESHRNDIKVIVADERITRSNSGDEADYRKAVSAALADFGSHPAVIGFYIHDEPEVKDYPETVEMLRIFNELAPDLLAYCNLLPCFVNTEARVGYTDWQHYLDRYVADTGTKVLSYDCYTQTWGDEDGIERYFKNLFEYSTAAKKHGLPFWNIVLSTGHYRYKCPDENMLRWQLNTSVAHGAKAVLYFFFHMPRKLENYRVSPIDEHGERTETFGWLARVNKTFLKSTAAWFKDLDLVRVSHYGKSFGGFEPFNGEGLVRRVLASAETQLILSEFTDTDGETYLAVTNNSVTEPTRIDLTVRGFGFAPNVLINGWNDDSYGKTEFVQKEIISRGEDFAAVRLYLAPGQLSLLKIVKGV